MEKNRNILKTELLETEEPLCPVFGTCGGCSYQDLSYSSELRVKEALLRDLVKEALPGLEDRVCAVFPSPKPYHSRSRLDLTLKRTRRDGLLFGFMPLRGRKIVSVEQCFIAREEVSGFLPSLKEQAISKMPDNYNTANLVVKTGDDGRVFWGGIGRRSLRMRPEQYLWTRVRGKKIYYSLETFFQANLSILPALMDKIQEIVSSAGGSEGVFLDLYSGVGLFGVSLSDLFTKVLMLEENPFSVQLAEYNKQVHEISHLEIRQGRIEDKLPEILRELGTKKEVTAMIDPPRKGLSGPALDTLKRAEGISRFFYLSCNPESLVRDLRVFNDAGWEVLSLQPFDFFPKTRHLETLAVLKRA